jgi:uncharacterized protein (TIGR03067 family)
MRRTVCLLAIALLVLPSLGSDAPKEYDGTTKRDDVQGTWEFVGFERDGKILPPAFSEVMIYRGGAYTRIIEEKFVLRGRYRADPGHTPPYLQDVPDHRLLRGRAFNCIYRVEGDTLRIDYPRDDRARRPQTFHDEDIRVDVYKRVK